MKNKENGLSVEWADQSPPIIIHKLSESDYAERFNNVAVILVEPFTDKLIATGPSEEALENAAQEAKEKGNCDLPEHMAIMPTRIDFGPENVLRRG